MTARKTSSRHGPTEQDAERLRDEIHTLGDYAHVTVRAQRGHLKVFAGEETPVARLTPLGRDHYALSFHRHTGRWEPMPFVGNLSHMANALVAALGIYLELSGRSDRNTGEDH